MSLNSGKKKQKKTSDLSHLTRKISSIQTLNDVKTVVKTKQNSSEHKKSVNLKHFDVIITLRAIILLLS